MSSIVLIGMPAAGKSTIGALLAQELHLAFVDTDLEIERQEGARLQELIAQKGTPAFLEIEERVCASLEAENAVIATGGSVVYSRAAMENLRRLGVVVYIHIELDPLKERLVDALERGVAFPAGQGIDALYAERTSLYERYADLTVRQLPGQIRETAEQVVQSVAAYLEAKHSEYQEKE